MKKSVNNGAMAKLILMGLASGIDVLGEIDKITAKHNKPPRELTRYDHDRTNKADERRLKRNAKRSKNWTGSRQIEVEYITCEQ